MKKLILALIACIGIAPLATATALYSDWGTIIAYRTGWYFDQIHVTTTAPIVNPSGCANADGYMTSPTDSGNKAHQAAILTAFTAGFQIKIVVEGCVEGRPKIIGTHIER